MNNRILVIVLVVSLLLIVSDAVKPIKKTTTNEKSRVVGRTPIANSRSSELSRFKTYTSRNRATKKIPIRINISYQSPLGTVIPMSFAKIKVVINEISVAQSILLTLNPTILSEDGTWEGVLDILPYSASKVKASFELYPGGQDIFISSHNQDYNYATDISSDPHIQKYIVHFAEKPVNPKSSEVVFTFVFRGERDGTSNANHVYPLSNPDNSHILSYAILTNLAVRMRRDFNVIVGKVLVLQYDGAPDDMDPRAPTPRMRLGNRGAWTPIIMVHEYGHYIQDLVYRSAGKNWHATAPPNHWRCDSTPQAEIVAWSEGYAFAFGQIMGEIMGVTPIGIYNEVKWNQVVLDLNRKDFTQWSPSESTLDIETEYYACGRHDLRSDEGRVAAMLYDLYDSNNDDLNSDRVKRYRNVMLQKNPPVNLNNNDFGDFTNGRDANQQHRYSEKDVLVTALVNSGTATLQDYIDAILVMAANSEEKKNRARDIIRYNYGSDMLDDIPMES